MNQVEELQEIRVEFDKTMTRVRKCEEIDPQELKTKYRKAYEKLLADALEQSNRVKDLMAYGGFQISASDVKGLADEMNAWAESQPGRKLLRAAGAEVRRGDGAKFYQTMQQLRDVVRQHATAHGAEEDQLFRMYAEASET